ncbi:hypothetical protein [Parendozoicomonas sp. Alg238-R29]|uniref:hypothetical protein n=1 Tax=Parendozoicomonas sp. Alg238-R29 TaxID=2993446 RepID=UPI00248E4E44|nr:hypothetical protein [Parendozoicomonas sp. Alg238-R29]
MELIKKISSVLDYFVEKEDREHAELVYGLRKMVAENTISFISGQKGKPGFEAIITAAYMSRRIKRYVDGILPTGMEGACTLFVNLFTEIPEDNSVRLSLSIMPLKELSNYEVEKINEFVEELNGTSFMGEQGPFALAKINYIQMH